MKATGNRRQRNRRGGFVAAGTSLVLGLFAAGIAQAATCKDELDRFERRLHSSSLAATDSDTFKALARQAEEAALLRDEQQCLETVAALNEVLPEDAGMTASGANNETSTDNKASPNRPAAPVLLMAGGSDENETDQPQKTASSASGDPDEDRLDE